MTSQPDFDGWPCLAGMVDDASVRARAAWADFSGPAARKRADEAGQSSSSTPRTQGVVYQTPPRHRIKQPDEQSHRIMLALKKKREAEAKAKAEAEAAAAASPDGKQDGASAQAPEKVSILGIGGKKKKDSGKDGAGSKKRTPGEIRIQKGEAVVNCMTNAFHVSYFVGLLCLSFLCLAGRDSLALTRPRRWCLHCVRRRILSRHNPVGSS